MRQSQRALSNWVIGSVAFISGLFPICAGLNAADGRQDTRHFTLRIENGQIVGGTKAVEVQRDDDVEIAWSSDRDARLHLHGYDIEVTVGPSKPETMKFIARASGRFPIHDSRHRALIYLEVKPR
jgi:hypothetical protein